MSSTVQDPPDFVLLAVLGEGIMSAFVNTCIFTLFYGEHYGSQFPAVNLEKNFHRGIHTSVCADNYNIRVSTLFNICDIGDDTGQ